MRRVAVTGAAGFIGTHLVAYLKRQDCWVRGIDLVPPRHGASVADEFLLLDLTGSAACARAVTGVDLAFLLAANMGGIAWTHAAPAQILHDNLLISTNSVEACRRDGVRTAVYASSACVYPRRLQRRPDSPPLREEPVFPADPDEEYGWEKLTTEMLARTYRTTYGLDIKVARLHAIYGPLGAYEGARAKSLGALCGKVAAIDGPAGAVDVWGDGTQTRSYCYIDDCVEGLWRIANSDLDVPVNLGSSERVSIAELVGRIAQVAGKDVSPRFLPAEVVGPRGRSSDNTLCRRRLGWAPSTSLDAGLRATYTWVAEQVQRRRARLNVTAGAADG
jgi:GDP-D-mannose 3', 5'-epimerase